jgi:hypothetical protein
MNYNSKVSFLLAARKGIGKPFSGNGLRQDETARIPEVSRLFSKSLSPAIRFFYS